MQSKNVLFSVAYGISILPYSFLRFYCYNIVWGWWF